MQSQSMLSQINLAVKENGLKTTFFSTVNAGEEKFSRQFPGNFNFEGRLGFQTVVRQLFYYILKYIFLYIIDSERKDAVCVKTRTRQEAEAKLS